MHPSGCVSPWQGRTKMSLGSPESTFPKIWSISPTYKEVILELQNFPRPLACTIRILMQKASDWKLLSEICRLDLEISLFLSKKTAKIRVSLSPQFASLVVLDKYCCSTKKAISVSTSYMVLLWRANAPFRVREPAAGPKKLSLSSPESTLPKIWSILPTLTLFNLLLQNFLRPLAFRISNYVTLSPSGQLFIKNWPRSREISSILWKYFWKMRQAYSPRFAPPSCYKILLKL